MSEQAREPRAGPDLLALYDEALPAVYGYLLSRCGNLTLAEDLTAETFLAAVTAVKKGNITMQPDAPWLLGIARHKLIDHWRTQAREQSHLRVAYEAGALAETEPEGDTAMATTAEPVRATADGDIVYLSLQVPDAVRARAFYGAVLGWRFGSGGHGEPGEARELNPRQVQGQALHIGVVDNWEAEGVDNPGVFIVRRVADIAAAVRRVRELGGTATDPYQDEHGVMSDCLDDQGNGFTLVEMPASEPRSEPNGERPGDITYLTFCPGDEVRASQFYGRLFGWEFTPGHVARGLNVSGPRPMTGVWGGTGRQRFEPVYLTADIGAAVRRVRELGGTATDPHPEPYGLAAECTDGQGLSFGLIQS